MDTGIIPFVCVSVYLCLCLCVCHIDRYWLELTLAETIVTLISRLLHPRCGSMVDTRSKCFSLLLSFPFFPCLSRSWLNWPYSFQSLFVSVYIYISIYGKRHARLFVVAAFCLLQFYVSCSSPSSIHPCPCVLPLGSTVRLPIDEDFVQEGTNAERVARMFRDRPDIFVPAIHWDYSSRRV